MFLGTQGHINLDFDIFPIVSRIIGDVPSSVPSACCSHNYYDLLVSK